MYMTQETFGNKINANGKTMKKKQMWTVEPSGDGTTVCLKSHLGKFLIVDKFGNVTCESEEKEDNTNPKFEMSIMGDKSGRIAFKSMSRGRSFFLHPTLLRHQNTKIAAKSFTKIIINNLKF